MRSLLVVVVVLIACGGPAPGGSCMPLGGATCAKTHEALFCEMVDGSLSFVTYFCPGATGCTASTTTTVCDFHGSKAGDPCPRSMETKAVCADSKTFLRCTSGSFVPMSCTSCSEVNGQVSCT